VAKADELRKQMKTPERTVDPDADDDNWHWDELGNHSNASKRKMDGPVDPVDGNRTLESNTSNVSGLECLQTDQFYLEGRAVKKKTVPSTEKHSAEDLGAFKYTILADV